MPGQCGVPCGFISMNVLLPLPHCKLCFQPLHTLNLLLLEIPNTGAKWETGNSHWEFKVCPGDFLCHSSVRKETSWAPEACLSSQSPALKSLLEFKNEAIQIVFGSGGSCQAVCVKKCYQQTAEPLWVPGLSQTKQVNCVIHSTVQTLVSCILTTTSTFIKLLECFLPGKKKKKNHFPNLCNSCMHKVKLNLCCTFIQEYGYGNQ